MSFFTSYNVETKHNNLNNKHCIKVYSCYYDAISFNLLSQIKTVLILADVFHKFTEIVKTKILKELVMKY